MVKRTCSVFYRILPAGATAQTDKKMSAALEDILSIQFCQIDILDILMQHSHKKKMNVFIHIKAFWKDPFGGK